MRHLLNVGLGSLLPRRAASTRSIGIGYGPVPLNTVTRGIRDDFLEQFTDTSNWIFQRWQPYPDVTGPETVRDTDMGITCLLIIRSRGGFAMRFYKII